MWLIMLSNKCSVVDSNLPLGSMRTLKLFLQFSHFLSLRQSCLPGHGILTFPTSIPYKTHKIEISKNTQKEPWFLAINPNGRIPALTDTFSDGKTINLFESGSIMQYLVDRYDPEYKISFPKGTREWYEMNNWLFFQNAGLGPMQGQASKCVCFPLELRRSRCGREMDATDIIRWNGGGRNLPLH